MLSTIKITIRSGRIQVISSRLATSVDLTPYVALIPSAATILSIATLSIATPSTAILCSIRQAILYIQTITTTSSNSSSGQSITTSSYSTKANSTSTVATAPTTVAIQPLLRYAAHVLPLAPIFATSLLLTLQRQFAIRLCSAKIRRLKTTSRVEMLYSRSRLLLLCSQGGTYRGYIPVKVTRQGLNRFQVGSELRGPGYCNVISPKVYLASTARPLYIRTRCMLVGIYLYQFRSGRQENERGFPYQYTVRSGVGTYLIGQVPKVR